MNKLNPNRSIAIIGGMGPQASAKLLEVLISMCCKDYGAKEDYDFPEVILNSVPVPDIISTRRNMKISLGILAQRVKNLESFNPKVLGIPCNTAHVLFQTLQSKTTIPFVSIIEEVTKSVVESKINKVGLFATPVTINSCLYQNALEKQKIEVIVPTKGEQKVVDEVIRNVLAGKTTSIDKKKIVLVAENLVLNEAEGIILGCTELPLIFPKNFPAPVFDSIEILASALLKRYYLNGDQI